MEPKSKNYVKYDGYKFYKDRSGYFLGSIPSENGGHRLVRLHVYVWEKFNGQVPSGYNVHHIDHNKANNSIENLVAIPAKEHGRLHSMEADKGKIIANLGKYARPKATEWHKSEEGREWHKVLYAQTLGKAWNDMVEKNCEYCGNIYLVPKPKVSRSRFCSNKCKTAYRYHSGADNVDRVCSACGKVFVVNKYSKVQTCSKECARVLNSKTKTSKCHQKE